MRLEGQKKGGFYPLQDGIAPYILSHIAAPHGGRMLDPAAGEGVALKEMAETLGLQAYGIELHETRAQTAAQLLADHNLAFPIPETPTVPNVLFSDFRLATIGYRQFNLIYLNPPYDTYDESQFDISEPGERAVEKTRAEYVWLQETNHALVESGLMVMVMPTHILKVSYFAKYLADWFTRITVRLTPEQFYDRPWKQVIIIGQKRARREKMSNRRLIDALRDMGSGKRDIPHIEMATKAIYALPEIKDERFTFYPRFIKASTIWDYAMENTPAVAEWRREIETGRPRVRLDPLMPMRKGHIVAAIAAGNLNNSMITHPDTGERIIVKGTSSKNLLVREETNEDGTESKTVSTDVVTPRIYYLDQNGKINEVEEIVPFMDKWAAPLTKAIVEQYPPRYKFDYADFADQLDRLNPNRKIPNSDRTGMIEAQKHIIAAGITQFEGGKTVLIIHGQMGTGKTAMMSGVAGVSHLRQGEGDYHVIVMVPPHLWKKWISEIGHTVPWATVDHLKTPSDVDRFFNRTGLNIGVVKETTARSGSGWAHSYYFATKPLVYLPTRRAKVEEKVRPMLARKPVRPGYQPMASLKDLETAAELSGQRRDRLISYYAQYGGEQVICPTCGRPTVIPREKFLKRKYHCTNVLEDKDGRNHHNKVIEGVRYCNTPLWTEVRRHQNPALVWKRNGLKRIKAKRGKNTNVGMSKTPLGNYIARVATRTGRLKMLIADEAHEYKSGDSARGVAFGRIAAAAEKIVLGTGTFYGGKASSIYHLLYRTDPIIRQLYPHKGGEASWINDFGIVQEVRKTAEGHGATGGQKKSTVSYREMPSSHPGMLPHLLRSAAYISLADLGEALPEFTEYPYPIRAAAGSMIAYQAMERRLIDEMIARRWTNKPSIMGAYVWALMTYLDSSWRPKTIIDQDGEIVTTVPQTTFTPDRTTKEDELLELITEQLARGRKVTLICHQTALLDITQYWTGILKAQGISSAVCKVDTDKREEWIKEQDKLGTQVIITHPMRITTGLDMLGYPTMIFIQPEYSATVTQQVTARPYRLGQTQDVEIYYAYYEETAQEHAIHLVAAKIAAATRINGEEITDDTLSAFGDQEQTDMIKAIAAAILEKELTATTAQDLFAQAKLNRQQEEERLVPITLQPAGNILTKEKPMQQTAPIVLPTKVVGGIRTIPDHMFEDLLDTVPATLKTANLVFPNVVIHEGGMFVTLGRAKPDLPLPYYNLVPTDNAAVAQTYSARLLVERAQKWSDENKAPADPRAFASNLIVKINDVQYMLRGPMGSVVSESHVAKARAEQRIGDQIPINGEAFNKLSTTIHSTRQANGKLTNVFRHRGVDYVGMLLRYNKDKTQSIVAFPLVQKELAGNLEPTEEWPMIGREFEYRKGTFVVGSRETVFLLS